MTLYVGSKLTPVTVAGEHWRGQRLQMQVARPRILSTPAPQFLAQTRDNPPINPMPFPAASWTLSIIVKQRKAAHTAREDASV